MIRLICLIGGLVSLAACASPETRVRSGLINAGLPARQASCMADRMVDRLSLLQLKRLGSLGRLKDDSLREMSVDHFIYSVRALKDPEILTVSTTSLLVCAI